MDGGGQPLAGLVMGSDSDWPTMQPAAAALDEFGVPHEVHSGVSVYFRDPDGARIELIADPLGEMYGSVVL